MNRKQKIIVSITGIFIVLLALVGLTYAYFLTRITGNENPTSISVTTANLELVYGDDDGSIIGDGEVIEPGKTFEAKTFTVTNNGNAKVDSYAVILEDVATTYASTFRDEDNNEVLEGTPTSFKRPEDFRISITCSSKKKGATETTDCGKVTNSILPIMENETLGEKYITNGILYTNSIEVGEVQTYSVVLEYVEANIDQSDDMNKRLEGKFNIIDTKNTVDITGTVENYQLGDKIVTNSVRRVSQINSDGSYKIVGLEADTHSVKLQSGDTETEISKISIIKGETASVGTTQIDGETISQIVITDASRTATVHIDPDESSVQIEEEIQEYAPFGTLYDNIFEKGALVLNTTTNELTYDKTYDEITTFTKASDGSDINDAGLFTTEDDYGTSYYFRGPVKNNYVNFAGFTWRIVRVNGDGSIRLILNGTLDKVKNEKETSYAGTTSSFGEVINGQYGHTPTVGYMHGFLDTTTDVCIKQTNGGKIKGEESTKEACENAGGNWTSAYDASNMNLNDSVIKTVLDNFYEKYIKNYQSLVSDGLFCGEKTVSGQYLDSTSVIGDGYSNILTYYIGYARLFTAKANPAIVYPTLECAKGIANNYSRYTSVFDGSATTSKGVDVNNDLKYPIALLSADELVFAGAYKGQPNTSYYLHNDNLSTYWWTMTPASHTKYNPHGHPMMLASTITQDYYSINRLRGTATSIGVRPVINLKGNVAITSGEGTELNPYVIK